METTKDLEKYTYDLLAERGVATTWRGKRKMIKSRMRQPCGMSTVSCPACSRLSGGARTRWSLPCPITGPVTVKMVTSIIASLTKKYIRCLINTLFSENERTTADFTICQLYVQLSA